MSAEFMIRSCDDWRYFFDKEIFIAVFHVADCFIEKEANIIVVWYWYMLMHAL